MKKSILSVLMMMSFFIMSAQETDVFIYQIQSGDSYKSISRNFDISMRDFKIANPDLSKRPVVNATVYIPLMPDHEMSYHQVALGETLYGISRAYGISVDDLIIDNRISGPLKIGSVLKIDKAKVLDADALLVQQALLEEDYVLHEVVQGETFYSLEKEYEVNKDSLVALNPKLPLDRMGLQKGMLLKVKRRGVEVIEEQMSVFKDSIQVDVPFHISFMLPLKLERYDTLSPLQTFRKKGLVLDRISDYYLGALIAIDSMRAQGASVTYSVYDTENNSQKVKEILLLGDLEQSDLVVGPFYSSKAQMVAKNYKLRDIPVLFPMYSKKQSGFTSSNFIKPEVDKSHYAEKLNEHIISTYCDEHIIIVGDTTAASRTQTKNLIQGLKELNDSVSISTLQAVKDYVSFDSFREKVDSLATNNWVVMTNKGTTSYALIDNIVALDNNIRGRLFANEKDKDFEVATDEVLSSIDFTYVTSSIQDSTDPLVQQFFYQYKKKFKAFPSMASIKGFDEVYDLLMRYYSTGSFDPVAFEGYSKRVQNSYFYQEDENGIKENEYVFIVSYLKDLSLKTDFEEQDENPNIYNWDDIEQE